MGVWIGGVWNGHFPESEKYFSEAEISMKIPEIPHKNLSSSKFQSPKNCNSIPPLDSLPLFKPARSQFCMFWKIFMPCDPLLLRLSHLLQKGLLKGKEGFQQAPSNLLRTHCLFQHRVNGVGRGGGQAVLNQILIRFHGIRLKSG